MSRITLRACECNNTNLLFFQRSSQKMFIKSVQMFDGTFAIITIISLGSLHYVWPVFTICEASVAELLVRETHNL